jgi:N-acetylneuraminate epimerase
LQPEAGVWPPVTTALVTWKSRWILPSGEVRPGVRTRNVIQIPIPDMRSPSSP